MLSPVGWGVCKHTELIDTKTPDGVIMGPEFPV